MWRGDSGLLVLQLADAVAPEPREPAKYAVYFDGACPLCSPDIGHYASLDRNNRVSFVDASDAKADLGDGSASKAALRRFDVRLPDATLLSGAHAFLALRRRLPGWRRPAPLAAVPGDPGLLAGFHRAFLLIRPALSRMAGLLGVPASIPKSRLP